MNHQSDYGYSTGAISMRCAACGSYELGCCDGNGKPTIRLEGCYQDGGVFYRDGMEEPDFREADRNGNNDYVIANYSQMVRGDHDTDGAVRARKRFAEEHPEFVER